MSYKLARKFCRDLELQCKSCFRREFGLERFVPVSLLEKMKRKEVKKLVAHFLKLHANMVGPGKQLTSLQAKLHYLDIVGQLPSYGAKCFSTGPKADAMERVVLVSPKFGISQIIGNKNSMVRNVVHRRGAVDSTECLLEICLLRWI